MDSAERKVRDSYNGDWGKMRDLSRGTLKVKEFGQIYAAYEALRQEARIAIVQVKNKYQTPNFMGYRDINAYSSGDAVDGMVEADAQLIHLRERFAQQHIATLMMTTICDNTLAQWKSA